MEQQAAVEERVVSFDAPSVTVRGDDGEQVTIMVKRKGDGGGTEVKGEGGLRLPSRRHVTRVVRDHLLRFGGTVRYMPYVFDFVYDVAGTYLYLRPRIGICETAFDGWVDHRVRCDFASPRFIVQGKNYIDATTSAIKWLVENFGLSFVADVYHKIQGKNRSVRVLELSPRGDQWDRGDPTEVVVEFGRQIFIVESMGLSPADVAKRQMLSIRDVPLNAPAVSPLVWVNAALKSLDAQSYRFARYVSEPLVESQHYFDPFFRGGSLSRDDLEDGVLIYSHRWDGAPISLFKVEYAAGFMAQRHGISKEKALFLCRHFRSYVTMLDGRTHLALRPTVIAGGKWWVWTSKARGWFACKPLIGDATQALKTGVYTPEPLYPLDFVSIGGVYWTPLDVVKELSADMGAVYELDPFEHEIVVDKPGVSTRVIRLDDEPHVDTDAGVNFGLWL
jgi:hypothetical protein